MNAEKRIDDVIQSIVDDLKTNSLKVSEASYSKHHYLL
jgi:hypothetical protein